VLASGAHEAQRRPLGSPPDVMRLRAHAANARVDDNPRTIDFPDPATQSLACWFLVAWAARQTHASSSHS